MKLAASRQLERQARDVVAVADGVIVLSSTPWASHLEAFDARLSPVWNRPLTQGGVALSAVDGVPWVLDSAGAWAVGDGGGERARVNVPPRGGMCLSAFAPLADSFVFAWQHGPHAPTRRPVLECVGRDGTVRWSIILPLGSVAYEGVVEMSHDEGWEARPKEPWKPESWVSTSRTLSVSGDAVLACFTEMPRSGIGFGYVVGLDDGALRYVTRTGPITEVAPAGGGAFLIGYQGYGAFETLRYERDGTVTGRWPSHGHYLVGQDVRVIELTNAGASMHVTRLLPRGAVTRGERLEGYYTSRPLVAPDATAYIFRAGAVLAVRDLSIERRLRLASPGDNLYSTAMAGTEEALCCAYMQAAMEPRATLVRVSL